MIPPALCAVKLWWQQEAAGVRGTSKIPPICIHRASRLRWEGSLLASPLRDSPVGMLGMLRGNLLSLYWGQGGGVGVRGSQPAPSRHWKQAGKSEGGSFSSTPFPSNLMILQESHKIYRHRSHPYKVKRLPVFLFYSGGSKGPYHPYHSPLSLWLRKGLRRVVPVQLAKKSKFGGMCSS